ncbi:AraC family transcriptional regulator [Brevibacterium samyangense]|uniref:helix-turn-helix domain-containing protein n=1 Tax=Brevibacterium samyangense TaxID=366888 RepID=UPI0031CEAD2B
MSAFDDTRGILSPAEMRRHVDFRRFAAPAEFDGLLDFCWSVEWSFASEPAEQPRLPDGEATSPPERAPLFHRQRVVSRPAVNISVGVAPPPDVDVPGPHPLRAVVNGVTTKVQSRFLSGTGWNLAAKTTTGGFGAWVDRVGDLNDRVVPIHEVLGIEVESLPHRIAEIRAEVGSGAQSRSVMLSTCCSVLVDALGRALERADPRRVPIAREVSRIADIAEHDRSVRRVDELATIAGVTPRTLQRQFASFAGVSPTWVIRRYRLLDAAELARDGAEVDWSAVAAELGYADQSHLIREFTAAIGRSPAAYLRDQRAMRR